MKIKTLLILSFIIISASSFAQVSQFSKYQNDTEYKKQIDEYNLKAEEYNNALYEAINSPDFFSTEFSDELKRRELRNIQVGAGLKVGGAVTALASNAVLLPTAFAVGKNNLDAQNGILIADGVITGVCGIIYLVGLGKVAEGTKWFTIQGDKVVIYLHNPQKAYQKLCKGYR